MTVFRLPRAMAFPDPELADPDGLLAVGGDLSPERLLAAYAAGIFPWYSQGEPLLWWCPDPRWVVEPARLHVPRSLERTLRRGTFEVTADRAFEDVVARCASVDRPGQRGTWITREMRAAYLRLHALGHAHSIEAWQDGELAGGLYGVSLGSAFFGESMFADRPDASKVAFVALARVLEDWGFGLIDCQVHTDHLARFGAEPMPRREFVRRVAAEARKPGRRGSWDPLPARSGRRRA